MSPQSIKIVFWEMDEDRRKVATAAIQSCCRRFVLDDLDNEPALDPFIQLTQVPMDVNDIGESRNLPNIEPVFSTLNTSFASQPVHNSEHALVLIDEDNAIKEPDNLEVNLFRVTQGKHLDKVGRALVDVNNMFEEPDNFEVNLFQLTQDKHLEKAGRALVDVNNRFEESDVDVTPFQLTRDNNMEHDPVVDVSLLQVSDTSDLGNAVDDSNQANEENTCQENDAQLAMVQVGQSNELGEA